MAITFTATSTRSGTDVPFHNADDSGLPEITRVETETATMIANGDITKDVQISSDELTRTVTIVCNSISALNGYYNLLTDVNVGKEFSESIKSLPNASGYVHSRTLTGIDSPFTVTITYAFPEGTSADIDQVPQGGRFSNIQVLSNSVVVVYSFKDSSEFNGKFGDNPDIRNQLINNNITRTYSFAL